MQNKKIVLFTTALLAVVFLVAVVLFQKSQDSKIEQLASNKGAPFVRDHSPSFGKNKNNVTIVEFMDPECESCMIFHPVVKKVFFEYKNETKLVYRYLANHANSIFAIKILEAAKIQNGYKKVLDLIFEHQDKWSHGEDRENIWEILSLSDLDMEKLKDDYLKINIDDILQTDREDASTLGVTGTPTIFVNGKPLKVLAYKPFLDLVESEIYK